MKLPIDEQLLNDALNKWGVESQIKVAVEECAELITALMQLSRESKNPDVITEIADVIITASQLRLIFGPELVDEEIKYKLERVSKRIYDEPKT